MSKNFYQQAKTKAKAKGWSYAKAHQATLGAARKYYPVKKTGAGYKKAPFSMVGYLRNDEKKYCDTAWQYTTWVANEINYMSSSSTTVAQGHKITSAPRVYNSNAIDSRGTNLFTGIATGATAVSRIGNKVKARYMKVGITLEAAKAAIDQSGEQVNDSATPVAVGQYMKTSFRIVLVRDNQVNNSTNSVVWNTVFGSGSTGTDAWNFAANDNLDIPNMGRFFILHDEIIQLDGDNPMCTHSFTKYLNEEVRFNSDTSSALTDKGLYLLITQDVLGSAGDTSTLSAGNCRASTRFCFQDA